MEQLCDKNICCGCEVCVNACNNSAISMDEDCEGFRKPIINQEKCVECGVCSKKCPILNPLLVEQKALKKAYAVYSKDSVVRHESSSGGVFSCFAQVVLDNGGSVFGTQLDDDCMGASVVEITTKQDLYKLRGSKYIQSKVGYVYIRIRGLLNEGKMVLFSGTPCQVEGLYSFLGKNYNNLYTVDIICHAVPSPKVWRKYVKFKENNNGANVSSAFFRYKKNGWNDFGVKLNYENGKEEFNAFNEDLYGKAFLSDICFRKSCESCSFKKEERISDITIADFWGIQSMCSEIDYYDGVSLVLINSIKGKSMLEKIDVMIEVKEVNFKDAIARNPYMTRSIKAHKNRDRFFDELDDIEFDDLVSKYVKKKIEIVNNIILICEKFEMWNKIKPILKKILHR